MATRYGTTSILLTVTCKEFELIDNNDDHDGNGNSISNGDAGGGRSGGRGGRGSARSSGGCGSSTNSSDCGGRVSGGDDDEEYNLN